MGPFEFVTDAERLGHIANEIMDSPVTGMDLETTGYDENVEGSSSSPFRDQIRIVSINTGKGIYVIDAFETKTLDKVMSAIGESKGIKIIQNAKMEQKWLLYKHGVEIWPIFDTYRASALIHNGLDLKHDLYSLYERELGIAPPTEDLGGSNWSGPLTEKQKEYAASDVAYLHPLRDKLKPQLTHWGLNAVALIEFGAVLPESAIELNGLPFDQESWLALAQQNELKAEELRKQLVWELPQSKPQMTLLGFEPQINLNSPPQMLASLRKLGIRQQCPECRGKGSLRDGGRCSVCKGMKVVELQDTREMTLAMYAAEHPVIRKLIDFRGYSRAVSSFGPEFLRWVDPTTGRIHTSFFPFTGAGRYASSKPNTQNIPRDELFRRCFAAPPGSFLVGGDWSNIEMRIIAELSQDPKLLEVFRKDLDAHRVTASALMEVPESEVTSFQRQQAKPVNFGFCLAPGTPVTTDQGPKNIEDMKVGDLVWTHMSRWRRVEATQIAQAEALLRITTESDKVVECTPDHGWLIYDPSDSEIYRWVRAEDLYEGKYLCSRDSNEKIIKIQLITYQGPVYDITVEEDHSFVANGLVSKNSYGMMPPKMVLYAMSNYGIALSLAQATDFRGKFFNLYSRLPHWHARLLEEGPKRGFARNRVGRIRYLPEDAYNEWYNTDVQGLGAEGLKKALRVVYFRLKKHSPWNGAIKMIHQVHDEIITQTPDDMEIAKVVEKELDEGMREAMQPLLPSVPVTVGTGIGTSWADT
jgi:DNA polymerase I